MGQKGLETPPDAQLIKEDFPPLFHLLGTSSGVKKKIKKGFSKDIFGVETWHRQIYGIPCIPPGIKHWSLQALLAPTPKTNRINPRIKGWFYKTNKQIPLYPELQKCRISSCSEGRSRIQLSWLLLKLGAKKPGNAPGFAEPICPQRVVRDQKITGRREGLRDTKTT